MNSFLRNTIYIAFATTLTACGGGSSDFTRGAESTFNGDWSQACDGDTVTNPFDNTQVISQSNEAILTISGNSATLDVTEYSESDNCTTGDTENFIVELTLVYGDGVPDAASICSNTIEIDTVINSATSNGIILIGDDLIDAVNAGIVPSLTAFDLICSNSDGTGTFLYFGNDDAAGSGTSDATRPEIIDDTFFLTRQ